MYKSSFTNAIFLFPVSVALGLSLGGTGVAVAANRPMSPNVSGQAEVHPTKPIPMAGAAHLVRVQMAIESTSASSRIRSAIIADQDATIHILRKQLSIDESQNRQLRSIQQEISVLIKHQNARTDRLSLAGCRYDGHEFPKGAEVSFSPNRSQICTDAITGKPTYGLAWHPMPLAQAK